ncbi:HNH endonuclease signature motif containing protein [Serratia rubidaea]|uniref:HNH endonuclease signature motif containing protein n=1 Tax=Serratia rubidaea TaxID=61652 RepID=UPI0031FE9928
MKKLPGNLYHLFYDELPPELYDRIITPREAWHEVCRHYVLDSGSSSGFNMFGDDIQPRSPWDTQAVNETGRYASKLKGDIECGNVVYIDDKEVWNSSRFAFYINDKGRLVNGGGGVFFVLGGSNHIIEYYEQAIRRRGERSRPLPTVKPAEYYTPPQHAQAAKKQLSTLNSKAVGRLLAAGGVYNQNPEMFAETAKKLGGEAAEGFGQVLNEQTAGSLVALSSVLMVGRASIAGRPSMAELEELNKYLGKVRGEKHLLDNIEVAKISYVRRDRAELSTLRSQFRSVKSKYLQSIVNDPKVRSRFNADELANLASGKRPNNMWDVHHKLPLDDSGTNDFNNLVLINRDAEHLIFTNMQNNITRQMSIGETKEVLWPMPKGNIYP